MSKIRFSDGQIVSREWLEGGNEAAQALLRRHKGSYPLCLCKTKGIPLHIRELRQSGTIYLARMPGTGHEHEPECSSYEPRELSIEQALSNKAISYLPDGRLVVNLDVPLSRMNTGNRGQEQNPRQAHDGVPQAVEAARGHIGLLGLIELLWRVAELNHWHPKMKGRRHYRQVYNRLIQAAGDMIVKGHPLIQRLLVPEPYDPRRQQEITYRRTEQLARIARDDKGRTQRFMVLGQIRGVEKAGKDIHVQIAHLPKQYQIVVPENLWSRLIRRWNLQSWMDEESPSERIWGMFVIDSQGETGFVSNTFTLLCLCEYFIPYYRTQERALACGLVESQRAFIKALPLTGKIDSSQPVFRLTDCGTKTVPLYLVSGDATTEGGLDEWYWNIDTQPQWPLLPLPATISKQLQQVN